MSSIKRRFFFESSALDSDAFTVVGFEGEEAISTPYWFDIDLLSRDPELDAAEIVGKPATLTLDSDKLESPRKIHGVVAEFEVVRHAPGDQYFYRALLVPRLWFMSLSRQNQIYQNKTIPEIIEEELLGSKDRASEAFGLSPDDVRNFSDLRPKYPSKAYPQREFVVQYKESDLDFISRWMEHEGIFYYFLQEDDREVFVAGDDNIHFPEMISENEVPYNPGGANTSEESVSQISHTYRTISKTLRVRDYNYRHPDTLLEATEEIDSDGFGFLSDYGDHFKLPEEGKVIAQIRAEEVQARQSEFSGASDAMSFFAGAPFDVSEHPSDRFNGQFYITSVRHRGAQGGGDTPDGSGSGADYSNSFEAIPADVKYRPERRTPKPKIAGLMNARVDAAGIGDRAEIDEYGRYKIVLPWDISGPDAGKGTCYVRMAQPYGGTGQGMHFPLLKDTEVLLGFVDGNPDRPVILGAVPNHSNMSVVTSRDHTKNVIQTTSGVRIVIDDGAAST